jgi:hypothetical protein
VSLAHTGTRILIGAIGGIGSHLRPINTPAIRAVAASD